MQESNSRLANIFESAMDAIITVNEDQLLVMVNPAAEQMFGFEGKDIVGKPLNELLPERFQKKHTDHVRTFGQTNVTARSMGNLGNLWGRRANGEEFPIEVTISQVNVSGEKLYCAIIRDITERVQTEQALRESRERFRVVFDSANIGQCLVDLQGNLLRVNEAMCDIFGYSKEELQSMTVNDIAHPDDQDLSPRFIERATSGEITHSEFEKRYFHKEGHIIWGRVTSALVRDPDGTPKHFISHVEDITDRKKGEEALQERVKELNCLYGISRLAGREDYSLDQILSGTVDLLPPAWLFPEIACARIILDDREFKTDNFRETPWLQNSALFVGGEQAGQVEVGYLEERDDIDEGPFMKEERLLLNSVSERLGKITSRKRADEQLNFQAHLLDSVEQAVIVTDMDGHVIYWNSFAERLYGWSADEALGRAINELIVSEGVQQLGEEIMTGVETGESWTGEHMARHRNGSLLPIETTVIPLGDEHGEPFHIIRVSSNITERKNMEEQLKETATSEVRNRLAQDLHDSVTQGLYSASLIAETLPVIWEEDQEQGRRGLKQLERLTQGALAEMRALLLELRPKTLTDQEVPALLRQLADVTMARTKTSVTTTVVGECNMPTEVKIALYRIAQEALNNVVKHARARRAVLSLHDECNQITLSINDNGCGVDLENVQTSGLGFGIMRDRARDINATLDISSQLDKGTDVLVEWQASKQE